MLIEEDIIVNGAIVPHSAVPIIRDSAGLFRSLSFLMYDTQERHREIRKDDDEYTTEN